MIGRKCAGFCATRVAGRVGSILCSVTYGIWFESFSSACFLSMVWDAHQAGKTGNPGVLRQVIH